MNRESANIATAIVKGNKFAFIFLLLFLLKKGETKCNLKT